jgi:hypothetical protein
MGSCAVYISAVCQRFGGKNYLHIHGYNDEFWEAKGLNPTLLTSASNMEAVCSTETLAKRSQNTTRHNNPEYHHKQSDSHDNLKSFP